jgi:hypothetical protein
MRGDQKGAGDLEDLVGQVAGPSEGRRSRHGHVFFVGPRKTGTTALYDVLRRAGAAVSPNVKESFFFEQGEPDLSEYQRLFGLDPKDPFIEVSPSYFTSEQARGNIARLFPGARIVVTLRHPVRRALSALSHAVRIGSLGDAEVERPTLENKHVRHILDASSYQSQIALWSERFPGRVLVLKQGGDGTYPEEAVAALGALIGIPLSVAEVAGRRANPARAPRSSGLARVVRACKQPLVRWRAHGLIRALKVFEPLLFTRPRALEGSSAAAFFAHHLADEARYFESLPSASVR